MSETALAPADPAVRILREPGFSMPQAAYTDPEVFAADLERVFCSGWLFAAPACEVREPGQYVTVTVGSESVIVVRDRDGVLRAHHNVCAHRGSRIVTDRRGCASLLVCPYHQWTYRLDGTLRAARLMGEDFPRDDHRLAPVAVREVAGLVFGCLAADPPEFDDFSRALEPQLGPHRLDATRVLARHTYRVRANWKTLVENNRECYHCRGSHPEFSLSNFDLGTHGDVRSNPRYDDAVREARRRWQALGLAPPTSASRAAPGTASAACRCAPASSPRPSTEHPPRPCSATSPTPTPAACAWSACPTCGRTPTATTP